MITHFVGECTSIQHRMEIYTYLKERLSIWNPATEIWFNYRLIVYVPYCISSDRIIFCLHSVYCRGPLNLFDHQKCLKQCEFSFYMNITIARLVCMLITRSLLRSELKTPAWSRIAGGFGFVHWVITVFLYFFILHSLQNDISYPFTTCHLWCVITAGSGDITEAR